MPERGSETFISAIGHLDGRVDLLKTKTFSEDISRGVFETNKLPWEMGNPVLMDMCMMASKLAYENEKVVKNVVNLHWKVIRFLCCLPCPLFITACTYIDL